MDLIRFVDIYDKVFYINKNCVNEIHEDTIGMWQTDNIKATKTKVTVILFGNGQAVRTKESLDDVYKRLVLGWK